MLKLLFISSLCQNISDYFRLSYRVVSTLPAAYAVLKNIFKGCFEPIAEAVLNLQLRLFWICSWGCKPVAEALLNFNWGCFEPTAEVVLNLQLRMFWICSWGCKPVAEALLNFNWGCFDPSAEAVLNPQLRLFWTCSWGSFNL